MLTDSSPHTVRPLTAWCRACFTSLARLQAFCQEFYPNYLPILLEGSNEPELLVNSWQDLAEQFPEVLPAQLQSFFPEVFLLHFQSQEEKIEINSVSSPKLLISVFNTLLHHLLADENLLDRNRRVLLSILYERLCDQFYQEYQQHLLRHPHLSISGSTRSDAPQVMTHCDRCGQQEVVSEPQPAHDILDKMNSFFALHQQCIQQDLRLLQAFLPEEQVQRLVMKRPRWELKLDVVHTLFQTTRLEVVRHWFRMMTLADNLLGHPANGLPLNPKSLMPQENMFSITQQQRLAHLQRSVLPFRSDLRQLHNLFIQKLKTELTQRKRVQISRRRYLKLDILGNVTLSSVVRKTKNPVSPDKKASQETS